MPAARTTTPPVETRPRARAAVALLLAGNLVAAALVAAGRITLGDVLLLFWVENAALWLLGALRVATARGTGDGTPTRRRQPVTAPPGTTGTSLATAALFTVHYGGFLAVHGLFTAPLVAQFGRTGTWWTLAGTAAALTAAHVLDLARRWFFAGDRHRVSAQHAMRGLYGRVIALHVTLIGGSYAVNALGPTHTVQTAVAVGLCLAKTLFDLKPPPGPRFD